VIDEASGVAEEIYEAAAGFLTSPGARCLLIGNPTRTSGEFFNAFHTFSAYNTIAIPAFSTPAFTGEAVPDHVLRRLVSRAWVDEHTRKWGEGSPLYQVRIAAEFPDHADDAVVALGDVEQARARTLDAHGPIVIGCDVARFGSDQTVIAVRHGNVIRIAKLRRPRHHAHRRRDRPPRPRPRAQARPRAGDRGRRGRRRRRRRRPPARTRQGADTRGRQARRLQQRPRRAPFQRVPNRRSEDWFRLAELLPHLDLDPDPELAADILAPRYSLDSRGRRVVERKEETKKRLRRSPDRADAVIMTLTVKPPGPAKATATAYFPPARAVKTTTGTGLSLAERRLQAYTQHSRAGNDLSIQLGLGAAELGIHFGTHFDEET